MLEKLRVILGSVRFWSALILGVVFYLRQVGVMTPEFADAILGVVGISITVRTVDKFSQ